MQESNHLKRIKSSAALLIIGIPLFLMSKWTYLLVMLFFIFLAYEEFLRITDELGYSLNKIAFKITALLCFLSSLISRDLLNFSFFLAILFALFSHTAKFLNFFQNQVYLQASSQEKNLEVKKNLFQSFFFIFGVFYVSWMPGHEMLLRSAGKEVYSFFANLDLPFDFFSLNEGLILLILVRSAVITNDICSYYFGKFFGKYKLAHLLSPNKTLEGSLAGILCGILLPMLLLFVVSRFVSLSLLESKIRIYLFLPFLLLTNLVAQFGDLLESLIKRAVAKKDSGSFLSGQGGVMDRCDSHVLTAFPAYYLFFVI